MTFAELKNYITGFLRRDVTDFSVDGFDFLGQASNNALRTLQRRHTFEVLRTYVEVTFTNSIWTHDILTDVLQDKQDGDTDITIKSIEDAYLKSDDGSFTPMRLHSKEHETDNDLRRGERRGLGIKNSCIHRIIRHGRVFTLLPTAEEDKVIRFDVVKMLPKLTADADTNFILEIAPDVMLFSTIRELNAFLRDDERLQFSQRAFEASFLSLVQWDYQQGFANNEDME